jgi:hypothetical protein
VFQNNNLDIRDKIGRLGYYMMRNCADCIGRLTGEKINM